MRPVELHRWPLIYHLGWPGDWPFWFAAQGHPPPDLSRASGFRLCSMLVQAAVEGMGVAIGRPTVLASEMEQGDARERVQTPDRRARQLLPHHHRRGAA